MILNPEKLWVMLVKRARSLAQYPACKKVFVAVSGGIDSSVVVAVLCEAFGPESVIGFYRDIKSNPKHFKDVKELQKRLGFKLIAVNANPLYDTFLDMVREQFDLLGLPWAEEGTDEARESGFDNAYASLKSRFITPMAGFIAKAIDDGNGRVFGTGNGEEDGLLRYYDKYGDGAVDNNILDGLTKAEVRQMARYTKKIPSRIITKVPSADLLANGDIHNDENELTAWARRLGFSINISYGAPDGSREGNIAWAWKQDIKRGVITGENAGLSPQELGITPFGYNKDQIQVILFLRKVEKITKHKTEPPRGLKREFLLREGVVDE